MAIIFIDRSGVRMIGGVLLIAFHGRDPQRTMMQCATWDFLFFRRQATVVAAAVDSLLLRNARGKPLHGSCVEMKSGSKAFGQTAAFLPVVMTELIECWHRVGSRPRQRGRR
jgi:hypothetical protein